ncbi:hypothetical protein LCGC14_1233420 [marine sediment metagenome]|uniref:Glycosyl hydrolase-like 10 n=2 Tax=root TaxID=1 RepID=A0A831VPN6_9FLAO|nr:hypothetical protein [Pricia antarctica]
MQFGTVYTSIVILTIIVTSHCYSYGQNPEQPTLIKGVYGSPAALWDQGYTLENLGVNSIFVHSGSLTPEMVQRAKSEGAKVFAEFATLNGKGYVEEHLEAWAINEKGKKVAAASWFMGVCPTDAGFRTYRMTQLQQLLNDFELDGVWMDYVHWHAQFEDPEPILPETCFSSSCLEAFSKFSQIEIPKGSTSTKASWILANHEKEWRDWRCEVIYDWTKEIREIVKESNPDALLGLYHCPWTDTEFKGARQRILGLDYSLLKKSVDVFSPMVYHERMGRTPDWVEQNVAWLCNALDIKKSGYPQVWPIVQAHNDPGNVSAKDFEIVLQGGLSGKSSGVMMFTTSSVADDAEKIKVMKHFYRSLDSIPSYD